MCHRKQSSGLIVDTCYPTDIASSQAERGKSMSAPEYQLYDSQDVVSLGYFFVNRNPSSIMLTRKNGKALAPQPLISHLKSLDYMHLCQPQKRCLAYFNDILEALKQCSKQAKEF
jgi:hypothetical protein